MTTRKENEASFEKSMERLEQIVSDMEGGELSLDTMIKQFEEGQSLIRFCTGKLDEVERKIERLLTKAGPVETEPFEDLEPPPAEPAARDASAARPATPAAPTSPNREFGDMLPLGD